MFTSTDWFKWFDAPDNFGISILKALKAPAGVRSHLFFLFWPFHSVCLWENKELKEAEEGLRPQSRPFTTGWPVGCGGVKIRTKPPHGGGGDRETVTKYNNNRNKIRPENNHGFLFLILLLKHVFLFDFMLV